MSRSLGNGHIYQNFPELTHAPDYARNYWGDAYPALAAVKTKYDPGRIFDFPQAEKPGDAGRGELAAAGGAIAA